MSWKPTVTVELATGDLAQTVNVQKDKHIPTGPELDGNVRKAGVAQRR
jgi:hypothetical protein